MIIIYFISGVLLWTFMEYIIHRFLGHEHKGHNIFKAEHLAHHKEVHYFAPVYLKIISALVVSSIIFGIMIPFFSWQDTLAMIIGLMGMYYMYELCHSRFHKNNPVSSRFVTLRKHHFYHHFHNPKFNHGVTSRFWDRVFGTFHSVEEEKIKIPRKVTMEWLMSGDDLKPEYVQHFRLT